MLSDEEIQEAVELCEKESQEPVPMCACVAKAEQRKELIETCKAALHSLQEARREIGELRERAEKAESLLRQREKHELIGPAPECACPSCNLHHQYQHKAEQALGGGEQPQKCPKCGGVGAYYKNYAAQMDRELTYCECMKEAGGEERG